MWWLNGWCIKLLWQKFWVRLLQFIKCLQCYTLYTIQYINYLAGINFNVLWRRSFHMQQYMSAAKTRHIPLRPQKPDIYRCVRKNQTYTVVSAKTRHIPLRPLGKGLLLMRRFGLFTSLTYGKVWPGWGGGGEGDLLLKLSCSPHTQRQIRDYCLSALYWP